ncbi:hypothetical protein GCM10022251_34810 [Phytohabitans flavus]|uniref:Uncharacterized protein n=1 Tax=Phytohabitans flavus TaxID=1076124 RepID=A0A6F8XN35_9ACTN|nr:hypothetical protein [Phytohabitans flavus]BCB75161.1 hypothetical protein Pflav_015710 [Phytohabitans flavus]
MAIAFELAVNFGSNETAARAAHDLVIYSGHLAAGRRRIGLHKPLLNHNRRTDNVPYLEMSVIPVGVGWGVALDDGHEPVRLTAAELTELGRGLYQLLARFTGYQAAQVGWDPEWRVDPAELRQEWTDELATGTLPGLVLAEDVLSEMRGSGFVLFAPGFYWIPYAGEHSSTLTRDDGTS